MELKHLFSPIQLGPMTVKNRIVLPSMGLMYTQNGMMNDRFKHFYYERAKGGAGLLITGPYAVDKVGGGPVLLGLDEDIFIPEIKNFNEEIHKYDGVKVACQLFHSGRYSLSFMTGGQCVSASPIPSKLTGETPHELSVEEIKALVERYGAAAVRAREAGFDAVEVLACTGYLITQFLSPITNVREDEYGGSMENRMRFALEIVDSVRKGGGDDMPIIVRVAGHDYMPGGHTNKEAVIFCKALEKAGVDAINVTGGWHETNVPQLTTAVPAGTFVYLANGINQAVNIPVMASNRLGDPVLADKVIRENNADMVCMGRPLIADPYLPNKAMAGNFDDITYCVGCNQVCFDNVFSGQPVSCMLNPLAGHEGQKKITPTDNPRKIVVIGGGPAGMKTAVVAAQRGHQVVLMEAEAELGGQLWLASATPSKAEFERIISTLIHQVKAAGVTVKTGTEATVENVQAEGPDVVVVATGAKPAVPPIEGVEQPKVKLAWDILRGNESVAGRQVVVIGGNATGCETALKVAQEGTLDAETVKFLLYHQAEEPQALLEMATRGHKEVTVVDLMPKLANNVARTVRWAFLSDLDKHHIKMMPKVNVLAVTDTGVEIEHEGKKETLPADTVILATGVKSCQELYKSLNGKNFELLLIGDAKEPRKITDAIKEGLYTAMDL